MRVIFTQLNQELHHFAGDFATASFLQRTSFSHLKFVGLDVHVLLLAAEELHGLRWRLEMNQRDCRRRTCHRHISKTIGMSHHFSHQTPCFLNCFPCETTGDGNVLIHFLLPTGSTGCYWRIFLQLGHTFLKHLQ